MKCRSPFLLFFLVVLACSASEEDQIRQTLNQRGEAFNKKDLSLYLSCISKDYQDKGEDFSQLQRRMEAYFKAFDRIEYGFWDRTIHLEGKTATVVQQFCLEVEKGGKKNQFSGKEALFLKREGRQWRIFRGL